MCGIIGYWDKRPEADIALGDMLLGMLNALACRGPDSAGVALFGPGAAHSYIVRAKVGEKAVSNERAASLGALARAYGAHDFELTDVYLRFQLPEESDLAPFLSAAESIASDVEIVSLGRRLEIVKQVGSPHNLESTYGISKVRGSHGIGHTRLSTESIVDLSHSQPFWGHGYPDLAIVHNGHITNYHRLRRQYEQRGTRFYTENDSEIIAIFLAKQLRAGMTLREAMASMLTDLDGSFSCLAATATELGFVKDPFSLKPLVFAEQDDFVAIATEEIAIRSAIPGGYPVREAQAREVRVWQR